PDRVKFFFCDNALAIKASIPRPVFQGDLLDADGHGGHHRHRRPSTQSGQPPRRGQSDNCHHADGPAPPRRQARIQRSVQPIFKLIAQAVELVQGQHQRKGDHRGPQAAPRAQKRGQRPRPRRRAQGEMHTRDAYRVPEHFSHS
ncbi:MAG: DUF4387 family protein, partial [Chloroflexi bacterium]|nr:DUF4387 family protein [Chloroflexota bacterium]